MDASGAVKQVRRSAISLLDTHLHAFDQILCCLGHEAEVTRVVWSSDGSMLASGSADGTVRIWEAPLEFESHSYGSKLKYILNGHPEEVYHVEFISVSSPEEGPGSPVALPRVLVASSESFYLWDLERQEIVQKADAPGTSGSRYNTEEAFKIGYKGAYIFGCARQPSSSSDASKGRLLAAACSDGALRLWAMDDEGYLSFLHSSKIDPLDSAANNKQLMLTACSFDSTGDRLACSARDGTVFVLDVSSMSITRTIKVPDAPTYSCCFIREGGCEGLEYLAVPGSRGQLSLVNLASPGSPPVIVKPGFGFKSPLLVATYCIDSGGGVLVAMAGEAQTMAPIQSTELGSGSQSLSLRRRGGARRQQLGSSSSSHVHGKQQEMDPRTGTLAVLDEPFEAQEGRSEDKGKGGRGEGGRGEAPLTDPGAASMRAPIFLYRMDCPSV